MTPQRTYGPRDHAPLQEMGDLAFAGIDMRAPPQVAPGFVHAAENARLEEGVYQTRPGLFTPTWTRYASDEFPYRASYLASTDATWTSDYATTYGTTLYSDPTGETWIVRVAARALLFFRETEIGRIIAFTPGLSIAARCTITQNFNELVITRGDDDSCLVWDGNWTSRVEELVPASTPSGYAAMPGGHYAVAWRERTWLLSGRDDLIPSNIADSTLYKITDLLYINRGRGDRLRAAVPVGASSLLVLKSQSLHVATAVAADLSDVRVDLQPVDVQFDSPGTALAADGRVWWLDRRGVRSAAVASVDADNKILLRVDTVSDAIAPIIRRIAWRYAADFTAAVTDTRLVFAVALDDQTTPQTLLVWNRQLGAWESVDSYDANFEFSIRGFAAGAPWLAQARLWLVATDGRIACFDYSTGEDIIGLSGSLPYRQEIATTVTTRAYTGGTSDRKTIARGQVQIETWGEPTVALTATYDGAEETQSLASLGRDRTKFFTTASDFTPDNSDGRFHDPHRQDYSIALANPTPASGYTAWAATTSYSVGNHVFRPQTGRNYTCLQANVSTTGNQPATTAGATYWGYVHSSPTTEDFWYPYKAYTVGDLIKTNENMVYRALVTHTSAVGTEPEARADYWQDNGLDTAWTTGGASIILGPSLDPVHSADVGAKGTISDADLAHVIALYNYRNGMSVRTGQYQQLSSYYSGYAPGPGSITTYHSADTNQDGAISLSELTRVIELRNEGAYYNTPAGTTTEDGFVPGANPAAGLRLEDFQLSTHRVEINREAAWCRITAATTAGAMKLRAVALECLPGPYSTAQAR